ASTGEADLYALYRRVMRLSGAKMEDGPRREYLGVSVALFPVVIVSAMLTTPVATLARKLTAVRVSERSVLIIDADEVEIHGLQLDGALHIKAVPGARIRLSNLVVNNRGWTAREIEAGDGIAPEIAVRGFTFDRHATLVIEAARPGDYVVDGRRLGEASKKKGDSDRHVIAL
ncbi:MAG TPA: hypothetical protein VIV60_34760, partial [Polyangiaceae bacterium]